MLSPIQKEYADDDAVALPRVPAATNVTTYHNTFPTVPQTNILRKPRSTLGLNTFEKLESTNEAWFLMVLGRKS